MSEIPDAIDAPAEEVPTPVTPEPEHHEPEHHEPPHEEHHHEDMRPAFVDEIIGAINSLKEASPVTPQEEQILDKSPVKPPWTHRKLFGKRD